MTVEQLEDLWTIVRNERKDRPYLRVGQSFWNNLVINYPQYQTLRGTALNCFHCEDCLVELIKHICGEDEFRKWIELGGTTN